MLGNFLKKLKNSNNANPTRGKEVTKKLMESDTNQTNTSVPED